MGGDALVMGAEREEKEQMSGEDGDAPHQDAASVSKCPCSLTCVWKVKMSSLFQLCRGPKRVSPDKPDKLI